MKQKPYFIKVKGCINCKPYLEYKAMKEGKSDCQLHELLVGCLLLGCMVNGHSVLKPFIHPDELDLPSFMALYSRYGLQLMQPFTLIK